MALPAGMGLSAAAAAAGYAFQHPPPTPQQLLLSNAVTNRWISARESSAAHPWGARTAVPLHKPGTERYSSHRQTRRAVTPRQRKTPPSASCRRDDAERALTTTNNNSNTHANLYACRFPRPVPPSVPLVPRRVVSVTSPPPPVPPPTPVRTAVNELRLGKRAVVPGRGAGLQAALCGKRGRRALRTSEGLSDEVKKRFPRQAEQAARLSAVEEQLENRIHRVRRKLLYKLEGQEWSSKCLRTWLSLEVTSTPKARPQNRQERGQEPARHTSRTDGRGSGEGGREVSNSDGQPEKGGKSVSQSSRAGAPAAEAATTREAGADAGSAAAGTHMKGDGTAVAEHAAEGFQPGQGSKLPRIEGMGTRHETQKEKEVAAAGKGGEGEREEEAEVEWFVLARLQGSLVGAPADGVERRFTSFFSRVVLELDGKAFPDVAAVEWVRSAGCEELHQVELKLPLAGCLSRGLRDIAIKAVLVARVDSSRPLRYTLSSSLCGALRLARRVETKSVLLSAVFEALRQRGILPGRGDGGAPAPAPGGTGEGAAGGGGAAGAGPGGRLGCARVSVQSARGSPSRPPGTGAAPRIGGENL
ncbi:unnamed protein product, partial [Scytosiphon promiscuus]